MREAVSLGFLTALILITALASSHVYGGGHGPDELALAAGQYIVVFKDSVDDPDAAAKNTAKKHDLTLKQVYKVALKGFSAEVPNGRLHALEKDPKVAYVEADQLVQAFPQDLPTGIHRVDAEPNGPSDPVNVNVAIIDTGIDIDHPDLNVVGGFASYPQVIFIFLYCGASTDSWDDGHGHGTHVAGTIGAIDNSQGVVGVAPGARLWAAKVLSDSGYGSATLPATSGPK